MSDNEKLVNADDLKYVKAYLDRQQDKYADSTNKYMAETRTQMEADLDEFKTQIDASNNNFKTQIETDLDEFKTQVENRMDEIAAGANGLKFDMNLDLFTISDTFNSFTDTSELIFNSNIFTKRRYNSVDISEYADSILEQMKLGKTCTVIMTDNGRTVIYRACETRYESNFDSGYIYIINAGIRITIYGTKLSSTVNPGLMSVYEYTTSSSASAENMKINSLVFSGV